MDDRGVHASGGDPVRHGYQGWLGVTRADPKVGGHEPMFLDIIDTMDQSTRDLLPPAPDGMESPLDAAANRAQLRVGRPVNSTIIALERWERRGAGEDRFADEIASRPVVHLTLDGKIVFRDWDGLTALADGAGRARGRSMTDRVEAAGAGGVTYQLSRSVRRGGLVALTALALALSACSSAAGPAPAGQGPPPAGATAATAFDFTGTTLDGDALDAATLAGQPVVLWFWAPF